MIQEDATPVLDAVNNVEEKVAPSSFSWDSIVEKSIEYGLNLAVSTAVLIIGLIIAKRLSKMFAKILKKRDFEPSLQGFLVSLVSILLRILVVLTALTQLGVEMTSFVALLGAAGLAIGMAFSGTLGNFAGGVMILIFRPYKVGDLILAQGEQGIVQQIQIFNTILLTLDNKTVIIPNGALANGNITNFTHQEIRRVDFTVGIAYGDDYDTAKATLKRFIDEDERILGDQNNFIGLGNLGDSSVNITLRAWCKTEDYWDVFFLMNERIYKEFGQNGLNIPFPQMDVHLHNEK
jgi:small conductance mechanosensitive channel